MVGAATALSLTSLESLAHRGWPVRPVWAVTPPSATTMLPVMNEASSEARNSTTLAISSGLPRRPTGWHSSLRLRARSGSRALPINPFNTAGVAIHLAGVADVGLAEYRRRTDFRCDALSPGLVDIGNNHPRSFGREQLGGGLPDSGACPCDHGNPVFDLAHRRLLQVPGCGNLRHPWRGFLLYAFLFPIESVRQEHSVAVITSGHQVGEQPRT